MSAYFLKSMFLSFVGIWLWFLGHLSKMMHIVCVCIAWNFLFGIKNVFQKPNKFCIWDWKTENVVSLLCEMSMHFMWNAKMLQFPGETSGILSYFGKIYDVSILLNINTLPVQPKNCLCFNDFGGAKHFVSGTLRLICTLFWFFV